MRPTATSRPAALLTFALVLATLAATAGATVAFGMPTGSAPTGNGAGSVHPATPSPAGPTSAASFPTIPVGTSPRFVAYDAAKGEIFVANEYSNNVSVISDATNTVVATIDVGANPVAVTYDSGQHEVFVADDSADSVDVISDATNTVVHTIGVGDSPSGIVYDSGKGEVFVANWNSDNVSVISDLTNKVVASVPVSGDPYAAAYDEALGEVFVSSPGDDEVSVIADGTNTVSATVGVGPTPNGLAYDSATSQVFVANDGSDYVSVISTATNTVVASAPAGTTPVDVAVNASSGLVFITNYGSSNVTVDSDTSDQAVASDDVGFEPYAAVFDTGVGALYVANYGGDSVSVVTETLAVAASSSSPDGPAFLTVNFTASAVGGSWSYTSWAWTFGDGGTSSLVSPVHVYTTPGSYQASVTVTDSLGATATSQTIWVNVSHPSPFALTWAASSGSVEAGQPIWFNGSVAGGTSPFSFTYGLPVIGSGCGPLVFASVECVPTEAGLTFSLTAHATDAYGATANVTTPTVTVAALSVSLAASKSHVAVGELVVFTTSVSGDSLPLSYVYSAPVQAGCAASTGPSVACTPTAPDLTFTVTVNVTDADGNVGAAISSSVSTGSVTAGLSSSRTSVDVGQPFTLTASVTGDDLALAYTFEGTSSASCQAQGDTDTCTPTATGSLSVSVTVTDSAGNSWTTSTVIVTVAGALQASLAVSNATPLIGQTVVISASASGGLSPYTFAYTDLPPGCVSVNASSLGCLPTQSGTYNITLLVTDQNGATAMGLATMQVIFAFTVAVPSSTTLGSSLTLQVTIDSPPTTASLRSDSTGLGPLTYTYTGLPPGCVSEDSATLTCTPTQTGTFSVTVSVQDSVGDHATQAVTVHVVPVSGGFLGFAGNEGYYLLVGVLGTLALVALAGYELNRRGRPPREADGAPEVLAPFKRPPTPEEKSRTKLLAPGQSDPAEDLF